MTGTYAGCVMGAVCYPDTLLTAEALCTQLLGALAPESSQLSLSLQIAPN